MVYWWINQTLPLNAKTNVRVEAVGKDLALFLNNTFEGYARVSADKISGDATVYVSDPWYPSASATLGNIKMTEINGKTSTARPVSAINGAFKQGSALEKTIVPADYALSFDVTPLRVDGHSSSIIHYSGDNSNIGPKGRMPGKMPECLMNLTSSFLLLISHMVYWWINQTLHSCGYHCQCE
jgi:hypothetical protein